MGSFCFWKCTRTSSICSELAQQHAPHAVDTASGLNIAAFNVGIAFGAWSGGLIVENYSLINTPWIGAIVVLIALALTYFSGLLDKKAKLQTVSNKEK